jgi:hypothetical protein
MPPNTVYVGRPTVWGNPFSVEKYGRNRALEYFRSFLAGEMVPSEAEPDLRLAEKRLYGEAPATLYPGEIAALLLCGKDLACWCPLDQPCHADVLLELANR